jgi:hypothetical protein
VIAAAATSILVVGAGAVAAVLAISDGGGGGSSAVAGRITTESPAQFRVAIVASMRAQHLNYEWVACVPSGRRFEGVRVVRCNVDFGIDPHVEAYCSVLSDGRLLTSEVDPAIPCGQDNAGYSPPLTTYGPTSSPAP